MTLAATIRDVSALVLALAEAQAERPAAAATTTPPPKVPLPHRSLGTLAGLAVADLVSAVCGIAAVACAFDALWRWAATIVGPVAAPLVVVLGLVVFAIAVQLISRLILRQAPPPAQPAAPAAAPIGINSAQAAIIAEAFQIAWNHKGTTLLAAALAGLVAGSSRNGAATKPSSKSNA